MTKGTSEPLDYKIILESVPDLYLILDPQLNIVEVSDNYLKATMVKRQDILGHHIFEIFPDNPNDPEATGVTNLRASLNNVLNEKTVDTMAVQKYDIRRPVKEGGGFEERYWSPINSPILGKNNEVLFIVHRVEDVTEFVRERKLAEQLRTHAGQMESEIMRRAQDIQDTNKKLRQVNEELADNRAELLKSNQELKFTENRLRLVIEASKDYAILMLDPKGYVTTWSKSAEFINGYTADEIIGQHFSKFYTPEDFAAHHPEEELAIARETGRYEEEGWRVKKNSDRFWANVIITAIYDENKQLIGFSKITRDLTERKKIESLKDEFISVVSHELRTPLTSIHGSLGLILGGAAGGYSDKVKKLLDIADNNCSRLIRLVNDILDIEKIEAGKMFFDIRPHDLKPILQNAIAENRMYAEKFGIAVHFDEATTPNIKVNVDVDRMMQVLSNLISNAVKFSPKNGEIVIAVTREGSFARVSISDKGRGIPEEFQDKIFEKFSQADSSSSRKGGGTGLGLAITKAIVERMGGELNFQSKPNMGTVFFFDLPEWETPQSKLQEKRRERNKVLICEDEISQAEFIKVNLEGAGYEADIATAAEQAKRMLAQGDYAILCLDLILPDQDGVTLIKEIRNSEKGKKIPIVVVSVMAQDGKNMMKGDAVEVIDWLDKPLDMNRLLKAFSRIKNLTRKPITKILHIEDDLDMQKLIVTLLEESAQVFSVSNLFEAKEILNAQSFDLAILDLLLPDGNGVELLSTLASHNIPVIVLAKNELDHQYSKFVHEALVKSQTSPQQLLNKIETVLRSR